MEKASRTSAFYWRENNRPSIFAEDRTFTPTVTGATHQQNSSNAAQKYIAAEVKRTGRNPGTLTGISKASRSSPIPDAWANKARGVR